MLIVHINGVMEQINEHKNEPYDNCATQLLVTFFTILIEYKLKSKYHYCKNDVIMHGMDDLKYCLWFILMRLWNKSTSTRMNHLKIMLLK